MEKKKKSMKLRTRVIISFFIIILVPIVMCALTFYFFVGYKTKSIGEKYGLANATYRTISNNTLAYCSKWFDTLRLRDHIFHQCSSSYTLQKSKTLRRTSQSEPVWWWKKKWWLSSVISCFFSFFPYKIHLFSNTYFVFSAPAGQKKILSTQSKFIIAQRLRIFH